MFTLCLVLFTNMLFLSLCLTSERWRDDQLLPVIDVLLLFSYILLSWYFTLLSSSYCSSTSACHSVLLSSLAALSLSHYLTSCLYVLPVLFLNLFLKVWFRMNLLNKFPASFWFRLVCSPLPNHTPLVDLLWYILFVWSSASYSLIWSVCSLSFCSPSVSSYNASVSSSFLISSDLTFISSTFFSVIIILSFLLLCYAFFSFIPVWFFASILLSCSVLCFILIYMHYRCPKKPCLSRINTSKAVGALQALGARILWPILLPRSVQSSSSIRRETPKPLVLEVCPRWKKGETKRNAD